MTRQEHDDIVSIFATLVFQFYFPPILNYYAGVMKYTFFIQLSFSFQFLFTHKQLNIFMKLDVVESLVFFNTLRILEK